MRIRSLVVVAAITAAPILVFAQKGDLTHNQPATPDAAVDFGVLPTSPLGGPPCATGIPPSPAVGGPADPCAYMLHHLTPEEVTVLKGGEVTFQIHGGGHAMAIYEASKDTTRDEIGQFLCAGLDPSTIGDPANHTCNLCDTNANAIHIVCRPGTAT